MGHPAFPTHPTQLSVTVRSAVARASMRTVSKVVSAVNRKPGACVAGMAMWGRRFGQMAVPVSELAPCTPNRVKD